MKPTDKRIIEIADYIWSDPSIKANEVCSHFAVKFRLTERRVQTLLAKAKEYNIERQNKASEIKDRVFIQKEIESVETAYNRREMAIAKLADIAFNDCRTIKVKDPNDPSKEITQVTARKESDQIAAIREILELDGAKTLRTETILTVQGESKPIEKMSEHELIAIAEGRINVS